MPVHLSSSFIMGGTKMDLLKGQVKKVYFHYLWAAFGSAMISSIYSIVDMAVVGQYQGPEGTAALAVVAPLWNIIYSLGLLTGIGGAVLLSAARGRGDYKKDNEFFSSALALSILLAVVCWIGVVFFDRQLLTLFGASQRLLPLAQKYFLPVKFGVPLFLFNQMLAAFLRNDNAPTLATRAVLAGGIFNIAGDYLFVFTFDMGIMGAGLATVIGAFITFCLMMTHFFSSQNTLRIVKPNDVFTQFKDIVVTGFSTFFIDIAMGILTMLFNRQIMKYLGSDSLAVYGVLVNISTIVQCCAYSVGQASQPLFSVNFAAKQYDRLSTLLKYTLYSSAFFGLLWTIIIFVFPHQIMNIFMDATEQIHLIAPSIMGYYGLSFLLLPLNIFSTYYFQSLMKPQLSLFISVLRGMILSGLLIYLLPALFGSNALWFVMPITEFIVVLIVILFMIRIQKSLYLKKQDN